MKRNAGGDRVTEAKRRPDGDDPLADASCGGIRELGRGETGRLDLDDGEVGRRIATEKPRGKVAAVAQVNVDREGVLDDMVVRENGPIRSEYDAGPHPAGDGLVPAATEEVRERVRLFVARRHVDLNDARAGAFGNRHEPLG